MYNSLIVRNSYLAEVNFAQAPATGQRIFFLDIPQLRNVFTTGLEAFDITVLSKSPNNATIVSVVGGLAVTLAVKDTERFVQIPVSTLVASINGGLIREFDRLRFTLTKSYVTIFDATGLATGESICFNFYYNKKQSL